MKCNLAGWLLGLPILALVWGLGAQIERAEIIKDLEARAEASRKRADLDWARLRFDGIEGQLSGTAYLEDDRRLALDIVKRTWGVWDVKDAMALVDAAPNYVWGGALKDDNLHLTDYVPSERLRRQILDVARVKFPLLPVRDAMTAAHGELGPSIWIGGVSFGLNQLVQLKQGDRLDLNGTEPGASEEADSGTAYRTIKGDFLQRMPNGILLAKDDVLPPHAFPFTWTATSKSERVEIGGHVPAGTTHDRIIEIAKEAFPKAAIVDKMVAASGAPNDWLKAVSTVLRGMARLESADARLENRAATLSGHAIKEVTAERVASDLQVGMPDTFKLTHKIVFREPTLPTISPFTTTLATDGEKISLTGYAPDERGRERLVASVKSKFPKHQVVDALAPANGAPVGWMSCAEAGVLGLSRLDKGRAEISGIVLSLRGETRDEKIASDLPAEVRAAANRSCKDAIEIRVKLPPEPQLKWQALSIDTRIEFSGDVIDSGVKAQLLDDAKSLFPKLTLIDNMRIQPGSSQKWVKIVRLGLEQLAKLRSGVVRLDGLVLTLDGVAPDTAVATEVKSRIERGVQPGYSGQTIIVVKSDAMIWSEQEARRKGGVAATDASVAKKVEAARRAASLHEVQRRAADAAEKALNAAQERQRQTEIARRKAEELARQACKASLNETAANGIVNFEVASNRLTTSSASTLDQLIESYRRCPGARVVIAGHTDSSGSEEANLKLSQSRAQAVLDYFVDKGLPRDKFVARGYGEAQPRVDNDTSANRARNRRIEFDVLAD